ncbi:hypothetical protein LMH72_24255 [Vibrio splendidus]|uniref:hypothetical protein n=1 Tax=Vibrio splendidus TaxID=29497 RepID=UPI001E5707D8|nr:hypothetical protein [Vibrio splendidus]MCC4790879.1 hypothetical protein [Vibrio splendidus]
MYAITSFSIEMHNIQVGVAPWRAYLAYRPRQHKPQTTNHKPVSVGNVLQCIKAFFDVWRVIGNKRQDEWCERSHKQQSVSIKLSLKSDTAT